MADKRGGIDVEEYIFAGLFFLFVAIVVGMLAVFFGPDIYYAIQDKLYPPEPQPALVDSFEAASNGCFDLVQIQQHSDGVHLRIVPTPSCSVTTDDQLIDSMGELGKVAKRYYVRRGEIFIEYIRPTENKREWIIYQVFICDAQEFIDDPARANCKSAQRDIIVSERELIWLNK